MSPQSGPKETLVPFLCCRTQYSQTCQQKRLHHTQRRLSRAGQKHTPLVFIPSRWKRAQPISLSYWNVLGVSITLRIQFRLLQLL